MRHGFLFIDKPRGPTSHDVVSKVRRILNEPKVGHLGTLDPLASGLLVLGVGAKALKVFELFTHLTKEYIAEVRLGAVSTTYDGEGVITDVAPKVGWEPPVDSSRIQALIADRFIGSIAQVPPSYSAISIGGERAHRLARAGEEVHLPPREVHIASCTVESYAYPDLSLRVSCGAGTYIRSLAHDLGQSMRCGGYLGALRRTKVGEWRVEDACSMKDFTWSQVSPLKQILASLPRIDLTDEQWEEIRHGRSVQAAFSESLIAWHADLPVAILEEDAKRAGFMKPKKVL